MQIFDRFDHEMIDDSDPLFSTLTLEKKEVIFRYFKDNVLTYLFLPSVSRDRRNVIEAYELVSGVPTLTTDKDIIRELARPIILSFLGACRGAISAVDYKIDEAKHKGVPHYVIIPKMGALLLYSVFNKIFGTTWTNLVMVEYTSGPDGSRNKKMQLALHKCLKPVFDGKQKGCSLIILDEFVSGSSVDSIFADLRRTLDRDIGIKLDKERAYYEELLTKKYAPFFKVRKKILHGRTIDLDKDYAAFFEQLTGYIAGTRPPKKVYLLRESHSPLVDSITYLKVYFKELEELPSKFRKDFSAYLNKEELIHLYKLEESINKNISKVRDSRFFRDTDFPTSKEASAIRASLDNIKEAYLQIIQVAVSDSIFNIAIKRRAYHEWITAFNIDILFVTIKDNTKADAELEKTKSFYHDITARGMHKTFKSLGIPTMDRVKLKTRATLSVESSIPDIQNIPEYTQIYKLMKLFQ